MKDMLYIYTGLDQSKMVHFNRQRKNSYTFQKAVEYNYIITFQKFLTELWAWAGSD